MSENFAGVVRVVDDAGTTRLQLDANRGDIKVLNEQGNQVAHLHRGGALVLGGFGDANEAGDIHLTNSSGDSTIHISGEDGDVILKNADAAEDFFVNNAADIEPGTVLVINDGNKLRPSTRPYDKRVAGVVSGLADYKPGIVLDRHPELENRLPVALAGKVFVNADATDHPIAVGDLLTTSRYPGVAMCASDPSRAFGAVIGKALAPLATGQGSVPILVSLQ